MLFLAWGVAKRRRKLYYLALAVLAANIVLTATDEFGLFDLIVPIIALVMVVLMVGSRSRFMPTR
jgi:peptidoglycan/LPS O-acetylase OafA/YrhL